jgi:hypothetical protein
VGLGIKHMGVTVMESRACMEEREPPSMNELGLGIM